MDSTLPAQRLRNPSWRVQKWILLRTLVVGVCAIGIWEGLRIYQQCNAVGEIEYFNGSVQTNFIGPIWLRQLIGRPKMVWIEDRIGEPFHVVFRCDEKTKNRRTRRGGIVLTIVGPLVDDEKLSCVLRLPRIKTLDVAFLPLGDSGLNHVRHLTELENLRLEGTDVTDQSIPVLSEMRSLKRLDIHDTFITKEGAARLEAALSGCEIRGPHNDDGVMIR